jgi:hypothetical protein
MSAAMATPPPDNSVLNFVIRMVVPMRREFGRSLDVQQFMRDSGYADSVLEEALTSSDPRLLDYANHVKKYMPGARPAEPPSMPTATRAAAASAPAAPPAAAGEPTEAELRARMLRKYTTGLR